MDDNSVSFLSKNNTQALVGLQSQLDIHQPSNLRNDKILYDKPKGQGGTQAMKRYASRDNMFDKAYDSLGSGCGS